MKKDYEEAVKILESYARGNGWMENQIEIIKEYVETLEKEKKDEPSNTNR